MQQINAYSQVASNTIVSNKKADEAKKSDEKTKDSNIQSAQNSTMDKDTIDKLSVLGGKGISKLYLVQFQQETMSLLVGNSNSQAAVSDLIGKDDFTKASTILSKLDLSSIGYDGKNVLDMTKDELKNLLSEDGFFGIENTANRIADFVIKGSGDDVEKLKKGLEGIKRGFDEAQKMWGGELPKISQDTIEQALKKVSNRINELGGKTLDLQA